MSARVCSAEGCGRPHLARGWCSNHYERWRLYGDALAVQRFRTPAEAFAARTERQGDCLIWTGAKTGGYGSIRVDGRAMGAHRYAWERENGPVPDGLVVDHHLFCDTACCEVSHLRLASIAENIRHRRGGNSGRKLPRGVYRGGNGYYGKLEKDGVSHSTPVQPTIKEASDMIEAMRKELFGEFAGKGGHA